MKSIEIRTTQNVTIEYELASARTRMIALGIDLLVVVILYLVLFLTLLNALGATITESGMALAVISSILPLILFLVYQLLSEVLANGQSWGKRAMGIRVVRLDGREPGLSDYLLRTVFLLPDLILSLGVLGALLISTSANNQRLGDMTANTTVIRVRQHQRFKLSDILRIDTLAEYEPRYPAVRRLSERDMLLVKSVVSRYQAYGNAAHRQVVAELVEHLRRLLDIEEKPTDRIAFLNTLIRDYIVLTR
jgi:uncharacterized RDD family membrane protein YckC